jgi:hypothetical protein
MDTNTSMATNTSKATYTGMSTIASKENNKSLPSLFSNFLTVNLCIF